MITIIIIIITDNFIITFILWAGNKTNDLRFVYTTTINAVGP